MLNKRAGHRALLASAAVLVLLSSCELFAAFTQLTDDELPTAVEVFLSAYPDSVQSGGGSFLSVDNSDEANGVLVVSITDYDKLDFQVWGNYKITLDNFRTEGGNEKADFSVETFSGSNVVANTGGKYSQITFTIAGTAVGPAGSTLFGELSAELDNEPFNAVVTADNERAVSGDVSFIEVVRIYNVAADEIDT